MALLVEPLISIITLGITRDVKHRVYGNGKREIQVEKFSEREMSR